MMWDSWLQLDMCKSSSMDEFPRYLRLLLPWLAGSIDIVNINGSES